MRNRHLFLYFLFIVPLSLTGQTVEQKLKNAYAVFEKDEQLKYAISSLYVVDANTGKVVFEKNSRVGLAPASTQKIITSVTAFDILGKDFRYETNFYAANYDHAWQLYITPSGDPTLGSWRWKSTSTDSVISRVIRAWGNRQPIFKTVFASGMQWNDETIPGGWIWEDIGNYYGAGASGFIWRENQYDLLLSSGSRIGDSVIVSNTFPRMKNYRFESHATAAGANTGDNAYLYFDPQEPGTIKLRGTIPVSQKNFSISGSVLSGIDFFAGMLGDSLAAKGMLNTSLNGRMINQHWPDAIKIHTETSPPLDSIVYYFNQKSVNLYGEALLKSFAHKKYRKATSDSGIAVIKSHWKSKGFDDRELNIHDGSGLSPQNRITTHIQVEFLKYARKQSWFPSLYNSLPIYNNMKLKSGTINRVKAFTGVHRSKGGREYLIAFTVNNYNGSASSLVNKMYKVLDVLK